MRETLTARERGALLAALRFVMAGPLTDMVECGQGQIPLTPEEAQDLEQVLANDQCLLVMIPESHVFRIPVWFDVVAGNLEQARAIVTNCLEFAQANCDEMFTASIVAQESKEEPTL